MVKAYYLTLFKVEGHEMYRAHFADTIDAFAKATASMKQKITQKKILRINKIDAEIDIFA